MIDIVGYEGLYCLDSNGSIWSYPRKGVPGHDLYPVKQYMHPKGYMQVRLSKDGHGTTLKVHRIVGSHFVANPDNKPHINHINGVKHDNRPTNLEWVTIRENLLHAYATGLKSLAGVKNPRARLSPQQACDIRNLYRSGMSQPKIAKLYGVSAGCIWGVTSGVNWSSERSESNAF